MHYLDAKEWASFKAGGEMAGVADQSNSQLFWWQQTAVRFRRLMREGFGKFLGSMSLAVLGAILCSIYIRDKEALDRAMRDETVKIVGTRQEPADSAQELGLIATALAKVNEADPSGWECPVEDPNGHNAGLKQYPRGHFLGISAWISSCRKKQVDLMRHQLFFERADVKFPREGKHDLDQLSVTMVYMRISVAHAGDGAPTCCGLFPGEVEDFSLHVQGYEEPGT
ncbi:MAG TPA: hypothetical protein VMH81_01965 [Bryobacteraceae bacterium]|nr:hypothetical protein [Bryobacteraceae bacterium]